MMRHRDVQMLLPPSVLGTADLDERGLVEQHLESCERCREENARLEQLVAMLVDAAPVVDLPADLRGQVLSAIDAESPRYAAGTYGAARAEPAVRVRAPLSQRLGASWRSFARPRAVALPAFALAAIVLVTVTVLGERAIVGHDDDRAPPASTPATAPRAASVEVASQTVPLATSSRLAAMSGDVALTSSGRGLVVLRFLPTPRPGRSWQAWTIARNGNRQSVRVLDAGGALIVLEIPVPRGTAAVAITDEPAGGSFQPTTAAAAYGSLT